MNVEEAIDKVLAHHGTKGMRWGVRKEGEIGSSRAKGLEHFSAGQARSMQNIASHMEKSYGYKVDEFALFTNPNEHFSETKNRIYLAMVAPKKKGDLRNVIHVSNDPKYKAEVVRGEKMGWFPPSGGKFVEANITHETAHGLFHSNDASGKGVTKNKDVMIAPLRQKAWEKAEAQARKDGDISSQDRYQAHYEMAGKISKYAHSSPFIEEHEAELFTSYHWNPNPPKFVDAFMSDIHSSMGIEVQPFSGRKVHHAS